MLISTTILFRMHQFAFLVCFVLLIHKVFLYYYNFKSSHLANIDIYLYSVCDFLAHIEDIRCRMGVYLADAAWCVLCSTIGGCRKVCIGKLQHPMWCAEKAALFVDSFIPP